MNRNTKLVLLISLFGLVCLAILWGRWFPDNRREDAELDFGALPPDITYPARPADGGGALRHIMIGTETSPTYPGRGFRGGDGDSGAEPPGSDVGGQRPLADARGGDPGARGGEGDLPSPAPGELPGWSKYTVQANDSLWEIAAKVYGDGSRWQEIAKANPDVDPGKLKLGKVLRIPPGARRGSGGGDSSYTPPPQPPASGQTTQYQVKGGDSFSRIAKRELGNSNRWKEIARLNGLAEDAVINPGQTLRLPPR